MSISENGFPARSEAEVGIPRIRADGVLFPQAWHARIFALIVAMVETDKLQWKDFQSRLVGHLNGHEDESRHGDEVTADYFEHWLEAAEDILIEKGFLKLDEIPRQISLIRQSVEAIRAEQTATARTSL